MTTSSFFMNDNSDSDSKELIIDYFLSWSIRCAESNTYGNSLMNTYCKNLLSQFLFKNISTLNTDYKSIESVKTWRQWKQIDLCVEVVLNKQDGSQESHALLFENKAYSTIHGNQLDRYRKTFEEEYQDTPFQINLHFIFFSCKEEISHEEKEQCDKSGYENYTMDEIINFITQNRRNNMTGNPLFDEFWIKTW